MELKNLIGKQIKILKVGKDDFLESEYMIIEVEGKKLKLSTVSWESSGFDLEDIENN